MIPSALKHAVHSAYVKVAEAALPPLSKSAFDEKRVRHARQGLFCDVALRQPTPARARPTDRFSRPPSLWRAATT